MKPVSSSEPPRAGKSGVEAKPTSPDVAKVSGQGKPVPIQRPVAVADSFERVGRPGIEAMLESQRAAAPAFGAAAAEINVAVAAAASILGAEAGAGEDFMDGALMGAMIGAALVSLVCGGAALLGPGAAGAQGAAAAAQGAPSASALETAVATFGLDVVSQAAALHTEELRTFADEVRRFNHHERVVSAQTQRSQEIEAQAARLMKKLNDTAAGIVQNSK